MTVLLEVQNLSKSYGAHKVVDNISFKVESGDVFGVLGPNGAGKSTTLSIIAGILKANDGLVKINGMNMTTSNKDAKRLIGIVPQEPALYSQLSARANLRFWGRINGLGGRQLNQAVEEVLTMVGLQERRHGQINKFSGGMKRRLNIAAGLIHKPDLLIMDEPTVGIDPQSRSHILDTVKNLRHQGIAVIYTSHYVEEVESLCNKVAIMDKGKIITEGSLEALHKQSGQFQELNIELNDYPEIVKDTVQNLPGVESAYLLDEKLKIVVTNAEQILPLALEVITGHGLTIGEIKIQKPNLENLFLKLTGKALRD